MATDVGPKGPYHIRLEDKPTSPTTSVGLVLARNERGAPQVREMRVPPVPPRRSSGPFTYTHKDPSVDYVIAMDDWQDGALRPYYRMGDRRYADADGMDARAEGVLALGMQKSAQMSIIIGNGGFESAALAPWTNGAGTCLVGTNAPHTGRYHVLVPTDGWLKFAIPNPTALRGRDITVLGYGRESVGGNGQSRIDIVDDVTGTTSSSPISSTTYGYRSVTATVNAACTDLYIKIRNDTAQIVYWDSFQVYINTTDTCVGIVEAAGKWYAAVGPLILLWNETSDYWAHSHCEAAGAVATSICSYNDQVYVGYGASAAFVFGTDGDWTAASGGSGNDTKAHHFTVVGDLLYKTDSATTIQSTHQLETDANAATFDIPGGGGFDVTDAGAPITGLYTLNGRVVVGTERGLRQQRYFKSPEYDPVSNLYENDPDSEAFARGVVRGAWLYCTTPKQGLIRFNGYQVEDLSELFVSPRLTAFGGRVKAVAADPHQLWLLLDEPTADATATKTVRLASLRQLGGRWQLHILQDVTMGDINTLAVAGSYLYALGRLYHAGLSNYHMASYRWTLPSKSVVPYADASPVLEVAGTIDLPIMGLDTPNDSKALIKVEALVENTDANKTIYVKFGTDGAAPSTVADTDWQIVTDTTAAPAWVTLETTDLTTPTTQAVGRLFQFQLAFASNSASSSPKLYAIIFHFAPAPTKVRAWECYAALGDRLKTGLEDTRNMLTLRTNIGTLEDQDYPIRFVEDFDGDDTESGYYVRITEFERVPWAEEEKRRDQWGYEGDLYRLVLQEVT